MSALLAVDTETTGVAFFDEAFGASVCPSDGDARWYEIPDESGSLEAELGNRSSDERLRDSDGLAQSVGPSLVFHNAKFDLGKLQHAGLLTRRKREIHDTEALAHLVDEHQPKKLKQLVTKYLGIETVEDTELKAYCRKKANGINVKRDGYSKVPREILVPYAIKDAEYTMRLFEALYPMVAAYEDLLSLYRMEMDLTWALLDMEWDGLGVSEEYVRDTTKQYARDILKTEWEIEDILGLKVWYPEKPGQKTPDGCFNPNSNPQIKEYFEGKGYSRDSYGRKTLEEIGDPFGVALVKLRKLKKIHGTYLLPMLAESRDGILHPSIRQHGTKTGRMSSGVAQDD